MGRYRLWARFRGWQWPLQAGCHLEVRDERMETVALLPADLVEQIIGHYLTGASMTAHLAQLMTDGHPEPVPPPPPRKEPPPRNPAIPML